MKKIKYCILFICLFSLCIMNSFAATASISASKKIEVGQSVKATVSINAAAWDIRINGTGNTNGCSTHDANASESGNNVKKTFSVTCTANSTGVIKINYSGDITDANGEVKDVNGSTVVNVVAATPKSTNNYLSNISVEGTVISPEFSKDTLEYNAILDAGTTTAIIKATKADNKASVSGDGEVSLVEGDNRFEIKVLSESGTLRTYAVNITVKEYDPIIVNVDGKNYTVVRKADELKKPESFIESSVTIDENTIPAFYNEVTKKTIVGLKDENGIVSLYEYNDGNYTKYLEYTFNQLTINIVKTKKSSVPKDYVLSKFTLNDEEMEGYKYNKNSNYVLVSGIDVTTGKENLYQIDIKNNTIQLFNDELVNDKTNNNMNLIVYVSLLFVIVIEFIFILSSKSKMKKISSKLNNISTEKITTEKVKVEKNKIDNETFDDIKVSKKKRQK